MDKLAELLGKLGAPILATAIGGPLGGVAAAALGALADAVGAKPTADDVKAAIEATADPRAAVQSVELTKGAELLDAYRIEAEDRANARAMQLAALEHESWTSSVPALLTFALCIMFAAALAFLFLRGIPESQLALLLVGALISEFRGALAFFFGTTAGSKRNGDAVRALAQQAMPSTGAVAAAAGKAVGAALAAKR